jgi:oxaloacetate decarboxylase gamma subunit
MNEISGQLTEAASIMGIGMIFVFLFLSLLVICVRLLERFAGEIEVPKPKSQPRPVTTGVTPEITAAISAAVHKYRNSNKN